MRFFMFDFKLSHEDCNEVKRMCPFESTINNVKIFLAKRTPIDWNRN